MESKKPKGEIKRFNVSLTEEQKIAKAKILNNNIIVLKGKAGSSKTFLACNVALDLLFRKEVDRIYISRPFVYPQGENELGILPGGVNEKLIGITTPILDNMYILAGKEKVDMLVENGTITILPSAFMKGMTLENAVIILDEYQNALLESTYTALTRLGKKSKMIVTGDMTQCDLKRHSDSGFHFFYELQRRGAEKFEIIELKSNHRHDLVDIITNIYLDYKKNNYGN